MAKYFVTGATGFIGGRVTRQLVDAGHDVVAIARNPESARDLESIGVDVRRGDITNPDSLRGPMAGVDGVFHIAGWYKIGSRDPSEGERINVAGTRNVLAAMKELRVPKGVYTSTLAVFSDTHGQLVDETYRHHGPWLTEYDRTKWIAHYEIAEPMIRAGLPLVVVQPGVNYGPGDTSEIRPTFVRYLQGKLRAIPKRTAYCWAHVEDTARAHVLAMERGRAGEPYIRADHRDPSAPVPCVARAPPRDRRAVPVRAASRCRGSDLSREQREGAPRARIRPEAPRGWTSRNVAARDAVARDQPCCGLILLREEFLK